MRTPKFGYSQYCQFRSCKRGCVSLGARAARQRWCTSSPAPPACDLIRACIHANPCAPSHPVHPTQHPDWPSSGSSEASKPAIKASRAGGAPASPTGARQFECAWQARARTCAIPAQLARKRKTPFFGHFVFFLLNSATCASSDVLPVNVRGRVHLTHERVGGRPVTQRSSTHPRDRTNKHERTCCCRKDLASPERCAGWHGSAAWLAEDERDSASV